MKYVVAFLAFALTNSAWAMSPICGSVDASRLANVTDRFNVGEVTRTEIAQATLDFYTTLYKDCNVFTKAGYCVVAIHAAKSVVYGVKEEAKVGMRDQEDIYKAEKVVEQLQLDCK